MTEERSFDRDDEPGGDPVCWLHELCPTCGAMPTDEPSAPPGRCWRCGEPFPKDD
ncbi:hypothetical protein LWC35_07645 [Pseudonocardia kujensis]|uniref:hypothetical protein n=1 Tax=Pseudonocardia kujensis TaxID=1128675 RepID=UPI001E376189|nr:hypothetical protein [Pseudonocardia kujensis]MCE0762784.1 hypothetical protein [Pseudonocardia kujensis]